MDIMKSVRISLNLCQCKHLINYFLLSALYTQVACESWLLASAIASTDTRTIGGSWCVAYA